MGQISTLKRFLKTMAVGLTLMAILLSPANASQNTTTVYLGSGTVAYASVDYDIWGYVSYKSNTTTALDVSSLMMWAWNNGAIPINETFFQVHDGAYVKHQTTSWTFTPVMADENVRLEADWSAICRADGENTLYQKIGNMSLVYTNMACGYNYGGMGGWSSYWYPSYRDDRFHY